MSSTCSEPLALTRSYSIRVAVSVLATALLGCATRLAPPHARPSLPVPASVADRYAVPGPVIERQLVPLGEHGRFAAWRGQLRAGVETADFHCVVPLAASPSEPVPLVIALPILAGGEELMWWIADDLGSHGYAVAWPRRVSSALQREHDGVALEELFRRSVVHARMVLAWSRGEPRLDAQRTGLLGVSLGSMIGTAVLAVEPDIAAGALCLSGGDLADLLLHSEEPRVERWRTWRFADDGIARSELAREVTRALRSDPARLACHIDTERVLLVSATWDDVVPPKNQDLLWESLGRPRRMFVPAGHYSAALGIGSILTEIRAFFASRM